jgi:hypothetical protein
MNSGVFGIVPLQTPSPVVPRPLPGLIPVTQRRSDSLAERLYARLLSPLQGGSTSSGLLGDGCPDARARGLLSRSLPVGPGFGWHPAPLPRGCARGAGDRTLGTS